MLCYHNPAANIYMKHRNKEYHYNFIKKNFILFRKTVDQKLWNV